MVLDRKGDEVSLQRNINDKAIYRYTTRIPYPYRMKDAKDWIKQNISESKKEKKSYITFATDIIYKKDEKFIDACCMQK